MPDVSVEKQALHAAVRQACADLVGAFAFLVDHRRYDELCELFTSDCVFSRPGVLLNGRQELLSFMRTRPATAASRHFCSAPFMESVSSEEAVAVSYLAFYEGEAAESGPARVNGITAFAEYHDEFKRTRDGWRISQRKVVPVMMKK
jgi:3-phenylpropionate/cinnamic acid dioxygenase small subunit